MLVLATLAFLSAPSSDSLPTLKKCGPPVVPIGLMYAAGTATFEVNPKGQPDSATILIISMERGTPAGLRSALVRELPACRFSLKSRSHEGAAPRIRARVEFSAAAMAMTELALVDAADTTGLPIDVPATPPEEVVSFKDERLEERPVARDCDLLIPRDEVTTRQVVSGQTISNRPVTSIDQLPPSVLVAPPPGSATPGGGEVLLRYVVSAAGRVDSASVEIVSAPTPALGAAASYRVTHCGWTPGRIQGRPVAVRISARERF